jgi:hypothetical protein
VAGGGVWGGERLTDDNLSDLTTEENKVGSHLTMVQRTALHSKFIYGHLCLMPQSQSIDRQVTVNTQPCHNRHMIPR